jgi:hypothetical protein
VSPPKALTYDLMPSDALQWHNRMSGVKQGCCLWRSTLVENLLRCSNGRLVRTREYKSKSTFRSQVSPISITGLSEMIEVVFFSMRLPEQNQQSHHRWCRSGVAAWRGGFNRSTLALVGPRETLQAPSY